MRTTALLPTRLSLCVLSSGFKRGDWSTTFESKSCMDRTNRIGNGLCEPMGVVQKSGTRTGSGYRYTIYNCNHGEKSMAFQSATEDVTIDGVMKRDYCVEKFGGNDNFPPSMGSSDKTLGGATVMPDIGLTRGDWSSTMEQASCTRRNGQIGNGKCTLINLVQKSGSSTGSGHLYAVYDCQRKCKPWLCSEDDGQLNFSTITGTQEIDSAVTCDGDNSRLAGWYCPDPDSTSVAIENSGFDTYYEVKDGHPFKANCEHGGRFVSTTGVSARTGIYGSCTTTDRAVLESYGVEFVEESSSTRGTAHRGAEISTDIECDSGYGIWEVTSCSTTNSLYFSMHDYIDEEMEEGAEHVMWKGKCKAYNNDVWDRTSTTTGKATCYNFDALYE